MLGGLELGKGGGGKRLWTETQAIQILILPTIHKRESHSYTVKRMHGAKRKQKPRTTGVEKAQLK